MYEFQDTKDMEQEKNKLVADGDEYVGEEMQRLIKIALNAVAKPEPQFNVRWISSGATNADS